MEEHAQPTPIYDQLVREQEQQCTPEHDTAPDQGAPEPDASPSWPSEPPS